MKKTFLILSILIFSLTLTFAAIEAAIDIVSYQGEESRESVYFEVVWSLNRGELALKRQGPYWTDSVFVDVVFSRDEKVIDKASLNKIIQVPRGYMISTDYLLFDKISSELPPGEYTLTFRAIDMGDLDTFLTEKEFSLEKKDGKLSMSDIALLSDVQEDSSDGLFSFSGYRMLPNPSKTYGLALPILYIYAEVYRPEVTGTLLVKRYSIIDSVDNLAKEFPPDTIVNSSGNEYIIDGFNVMGFPEGSYAVRLEVEDVALAQKVAEQDNFSVSKRPDSIMVQRGISEMMDLEQELKFVEYYMNTNDKSILDKLTDDGKREYLLNWWEKMDPDSSTKTNEFRQEIVKRWHYANQYYDESSSDEPLGWRSDRGRVYIQYGPPDNIERSPITMGTNPYEIWEYYSLQGGIVFIFADTRGIGEFKLMHSDATGEYHDEYWEDKILQSIDTHDDYLNQ